MNDKRLTKSFVEKKEKAVLVFMQQARTLAEINKRKSKT